MDSKGKKKGECGWQGPDHAAPYPVSRLAPPVSLVEMAREIEEADRFTGARVNAQLKVIAGQIEDLQNKAREIMADARREQELHRADCAFKKIPGRVYIFTCETMAGAIFQCCRRRTGPVSRPTGSRGPSGWVMI